MSTTNEENTSTPDPDEISQQQSCSNSETLDSPQPENPEAMNIEEESETTQPAEDPGPTGNETTSPLDTHQRKDSEEETSTLTAPADSITPTHSSTEADQTDSLTVTPTEYALPNGKDGEPYRVEHLKEKIFSDAASEILTYYIEGLDESGITLLENEDTLDGIPTLIDNEPKVIQIELFYHLRNQERKPPFKHKLRFAINPDPQKLWKNIPSNREKPYWKSDEDCELLEEPGSGRLIAASKRGRSHAHEGTCRDDHYAIKYFHQSGWWLSIVADGAGSAIYSRKGAEIACTAGTKLFEDSIPFLDSEQLTNAICEYAEGSESSKNEVFGKLQELFIKRIGYPVCLEIYEHAKTSSHKAKDYNTTFLISAWKKTPDGWFVCAFSIGDGGIAVLHESEITPLNKGDEGEFSGETIFLTSNNVWEDSAALRNRVKFGLFKDVHGIYGMSDGITDPYFETEHNFSQLEKWHKFTEEIDSHLAQSASPEKRLLDWMDFWSPGNHDDRTLTVFQPVPPQTQREENA